MFFLTISDFAGGSIEPSIPFQTGPIEVGDSRRYVAYEESETCYGYLNSYVVSSPVAWRTDNANVASVIVGNVFGEGSGSATISATWDVQHSTVFPCSSGGGYSSFFTGDKSEPCEEKKEPDNKIENRLEGREIKYKRDIKSQIPECGTCSSRTSSFTAYKTVSVSAAASCAVPINFRQVYPGIDIGSGTLYFERYSWDSSTGNLQDLSSCTVGEIVTYPGVGDYFPPSPPFPAGGFINPTVIDVAGNSIGFEDVHRTRGNFVAPYSSASFTAVQYYRYSCPCMNNGAPVNLAGPIDIVRSVTIADRGTWKFTITKSGDSATINPLP